ncbi:hypothetical protein [Actinomadura hibisca]|uniref:hypothetical protein n=1 Tax=Actinomadura hibisca TaxID=68565 RepID=UPI00082A3EFC|nr:hypothetical protein [Actinomadura hibisca]
MTERSPAEPLCVSPDADLSAAAVAARAQQTRAEGRRPCDFGGGPISEHRRADTKFCSDYHRVQAHRARTRAAAAADHVPLADFRDSVDRFVPAAEQLGELVAGAKALMSQAMDTTVERARTAQADRLAAEQREADAKRQAADAEQAAARADRRTAKALEAQRAAEADAEAERQRADQAVTIAAKQIAEHEHARGAAEGARRAAEDQLLEMVGRLRQAEQDLEQLRGQQAETAAALAAAHTEIATQRGELRAATDRAERAERQAQAAERAQHEERERAAVAVAETEQRHRAQLDQVRTELTARAERAEARADQQAASIEELRAELTARADRAEQRADRAEARADQQSASGAAALDGLRAALRLPEITDLDGTPGVAIDGSVGVLLEGDGRIVAKRLPEVYSAEGALQTARALLAAHAHLTATVPSSRASAE